MQVANPPRAILTCLFLGLLLVVTSLIYYNGLYGPFFLDDIQNLSFAKITTPSWQEWLKVSLSNSSGPFGRPLSIISFALNEYCLGASPFTYKIVNVAIHLFIGILIYALITRLLSILNSDTKINTIVAFVTSALWLLHPLQVSTVLYAVQRMTQLSTLFLVLGMLFYVHNKPKLSFLCWPLAIFSKETGVLLPFYLLAIEYILMHKNSESNKNFRYLLIGSVSTVALGLAYYAMHYTRYASIFEGKGYTLVQQLLTQIQILCFYLSLIAVPKLSHMSLFHDDFSIFTQANPSIFVCSLTIISLIGLSFLAKKKHPVLALGLLFFFISHLIESTVLPLELIFEHRNYLALLGPMLILSYYTVFYLSSTLRIAMLLSATLIAFCFLTFMRTQIWSHPELFLKLALTDHPKSPRAHVEWANFLLEHHQFSQAHKHLEIAHQLAPRDAGIRLHQLLMQCEHPLIPTTGPQHELAYQALIHDINYQNLTPYSILVFNNLVEKSFNHTCSSLSSQEILNLLNIAISNPHVQSQKNHLSTLHHLRAGMEILHNDFSPALKDLETAYQIYPKRLEPLIEKAHVYLKTNQPKEAALCLKRVTQLAQTQFVKDRWILDQLEMDMK